MSRWTKWLILGGAALMVLSRKPGKPPVVLRSGLKTHPRSEPPRFIVVHHSATYSPQSTFNVLLSKGLSTDFEVGPDGKIWQYADPSKEYTLHAEGWNKAGIGIDVTGPLKGTEPFTLAQKASLNKLVRWLCAEFSIPCEVHPWGYDAGLSPKTFRGILAHANVKANKPDPSYTANTKDGAFWNEMKERLA